VYVQAPPTGIYDFSLVAVPPLGQTLQKITRLPVPANRTEFIPDGFRGVCIHALSNHKTVIFSAPPGQDQSSELSEQLKLISDTASGLALSPVDNETFQKSIKGVQDLLDKSVGELRTRLHATTFNNNGSVEVQSGTSRLAGPPSR
jgi:hypothetical protein